MAWGRNEKIPPPSLSMSTIVADRPCSLRRDERVEVVQERRRPRRRARPARPRRRRRRARSRRRHRCRSRRGSTAAGWRGHSPATRRRDRGPACCCRPTAAPRSGSSSPSTANGWPSNGSSRASTPASHSASARSAARSASVQAVAHARSGGAAVLGVRASSSVASAIAVAAASAWTKVVGMIAGSLQPPSPSTTICAGMTSPRRVSSGLEVGVAPNRITSSGRCSSRQGPGRTRWSACDRTSARSCGPQRTPDSGSAAIG